MSTPNIPSAKTQTPTGDKSVAAPKTTETGVTKSPTTGSSLSSGSSEQSKTSTQGAEAQKDRVANAQDASRTANTPTSKTLAETERTAATRESPDNKQMDKSFSEVKGEVLQGDSFRLTLKRGNMTFYIPVPVEGSRNVTVLDNTFRIVDAIRNASGREELEDKFASFIQS